jgi:hypothetical protein
MVDQVLNLKKSLQTEVNYVWFPLTKIFLVSAKQNAAQYCRNQRHQQVAPNQQPIPRWHHSSWPRFSLEDPSMQMVQSWSKLTIQKSVWRITRNLSTYRYPENQVLHDAEFLQHVDANLVLHKA